MPIELRVLAHKSHSQAMQDIFVYNVVSENTTYIEIGAYKPASKNNTYVLETALGYRGFSIELNRKWQQAWLDCPERTNPILWDDALTFDYAAQCEKQGLPKHLGYLSCDIEPPTNTLAALQSIIQQGLSFDCITFEHDRSNPGFTDLLPLDIESQATKFLESHGYRIAVSDVSANKDPTYIFETWYVHESVVWPNWTFQQWKQQYLATDKGHK
jgi:hypothetical protein